MKGKLLPPVLTLVLALLTAGVSRGSDWLSTPQSIGSGEVMALAEIPPLCQERGKNCGDILDAQGHKVNCGTCTPPDTCEGSGIPNVCGCTPKTCAGHCGDFDPGCGRAKLSCGGCTLPQTCGGGGTANVCGCKPKTCAGLNCGSIDPGCGRSPLSCGQCSGTEVCRGNVCCAPKTCAGRTCGLIAPGCGLPSLSCGQCSAGDVCDKTSGDCCTPETCAGRTCGSIAPGCGLSSLSCGQCPGDKECIDGRCQRLTGDCPCGGHRPRCQKCPGLIAESPQTTALCAAQKKNCGLIDDGHGKKVDCGTCKAPETCGGGGVPNVCGQPPKKK